jgi:DNA-binding GntR family transcriptional regulator
VSRVPIREAIVQLEHEGLIRSDPRHIATVVGFTEQDLADVYDCRLLLESHAARRAAACIDAEGVARLRTLADQMQAALAAGQLERISVADIEFHRQIIALSGNRILCNSWEPLAGLIGVLISIADVVVLDIPRAVASHHTIARALAGHDAEQAVSLLYSHLEEGEALMYETLTKARSGQDVTSTPAR